MDNYINLKYVRPKPERGFFKRLAVFSVALYVIAATVFDAVQTNLVVIASIAIYFCFGCCVLHLVTRGVFKLNPITVFMIMLGVILSIGALYSPASKSLIGMYLYRYWASTVLIVCVSNTIESQEDVDIVIDAYIIAGAALAIYMYSTFGLENLATEFERIDEQLGNQNAIGLSCSLSVAFGIFKLVSTKGSKRILYAALSVVALPAIMFSGSRKAILVLAIALVALFFIYNTNKAVVIRVVIAAAVVAAIIAMIYYIPAFQMIKERFLSLIQVSEGNSSEAITGTSDMLRVKFIEEGLAAFKSSPIFGKGYLYSMYLFGVYSHNNFIELLMNGGIVSFIAFYVIYVYVALNIFKMSKAKVSRKYITLVAMMILSLIVADFGVVTYDERITLILLTLCCLDYIPKPKGENTVVNAVEDDKSSIKKYLK